MEDFKCIHFEERIFLFDKNVISILVHTVYEPILFGLRIGVEEVHNALYSTS